MSKLHPTIVSVCVLAACVPARAADGDLDLSFGIDGIGLFGAKRVRGFPAIEAQADGRLVVCDSIQSVTSKFDVLIERFNADGSRDVSFGTNNGSTILSFDGRDLDDLCAGLAVQQDGRIVVVGTRIGGGNPDTGAPWFELARIDANGAHDPSFAGGAGYLIFGFDGSDGGASANAVALDHAGRIVITGSAAGGMNLEIAVARILSDGTFDAKFNGSGRKTINLPPTGSSYDYAAEVAIDSEGRIVLTGSANGSTALLRLDDDGSMDETFGQGGSTVIDAGIPHAILIDHRERIVTVGQIAMAGAGAQDNRDMSVARFRRDGSIDKAFGTDGLTVVPFDAAASGEGRDVALDVVEQRDGKLVVLGFAEYGDQGYSDAAAARLLPNGTLDPTFGNAGKATFSFPIGTPPNAWFFGAAISGGRVVAAGTVRNGNTSTWSVDDLLIRLQNDAILADDFDP